MGRIDSTLLARYLAGEAGPDEHARVEALVASDPELARELARLRQAWGARPAPGTWDVDAAWSRVGRRLDAAPVVPIDRARRRWVALAAAAAILAAFGLYRGLGGRTATHATGPGEQQIVTLGDGSRITLAPGSRLRIGPGYGNPDREVTLEGRAWFEVEHDAARPFRVRTAGALIEDLGTEFEVLAPRGADTVQVVVLTGAVSVRPVGGAAKSVTLGPRDLARVTASGTSPVRHQVEAERLVAWRRGTLGFDGAPLGEILAELGRWYDLEFRVADAGLAERHFSGDFPTADLEEVVAIFEALGFGVDRDAGAITLRPGR